MRSLRIAFCLLCGAYTFPLEAAFVNGDFESGDLMGWSSSGNASVSGPSLYPGGGSFYGRVSATNGASAQLSQAFAIGQTTLLEFLYYTSTTDSQDTSIAYTLTNVDLASTVYLVLNSAGGEDLFEPPDFVPAISYVITTPGNYVLSIDATSSTGGSAYGEIENVTLTAEAVPEVSSLLFGCLGAATTILVVHRRRTRLAAHD